MSVQFKKTFEHVILIEGGYSDNPSDSGGKTKYGITESVARDAGYAGDMRDMPLDLAEQIYKTSYWDVHHCDDIAILSSKIAAEMFDTGVNMGVKAAARMLQRSLNALNNKQEHYQDIAIDGAVGPATLEALRAFLLKRGSNGEIVMMRALNSLQGARYIELAETREKDEEFLYGWLLQRVK